MLRSFAHLWLDQDLADVDILLTVQTRQTQGSAEQLPGAPLAKVPAHRAILTLSPYLRAQILRWHKKRPAEEQAEPQPPARTHTSTQRQQQAEQTPEPNNNSSRPQIVLILQGAEQQPAAMACLEALYATKPLPQLLSELSQEQQLQAALLADMWEVPEVGTAAVEQLLSAPLCSRLSEAAAQQLLHMPAHPDCLQPVLKQVLLSLLGDLEAAWADAELKNSLLGLPLHLMLQLLSCDELQVACEETVLYTAQKYVNQLEDIEQRQHAVQKLAPLIRAPHLSTYWLSASVLSQDTHLLVLNTLPDDVSMLLLLRQADKAAQSSLLMDRLLPGWPASWALGRRIERKVDSVQVVWQLDIEALKQAAQRCVQQQEEKVYLPSPVTPPFHGFAWRMRICCELGANKDSVQVGLFAQPHTEARGVFYKFTAQLLCGDARFTSFTSEVLCAGVDGVSSSCGRKNFFAVGYMPGGWDEAAWVDLGLPTTGSLPLTLTVTGVQVS